VSAVAATFALAGMGSVMLQASAQPVDSQIAAKCALGTGTIDVTIPLTVDDKVDPVKAGGSETLVTKTGMPTLPVEATINKLVVTMPVPAQIGSIDSVTFSGGNMKSAYSVSGNDVIVTFTGPVSSKDIEVPTVTAGLTVRDDATGPIAWKTDSEVDADTNYGMATCKPNDPNQTVNTTAVTAGSASTTAPAPTTTAPATSPTTTAPAKSTPPKSNGTGVSGSAKIGVTPNGATGSASGSASGSPSVPGMPAQPSVPAVPTPALPAQPTSPSPGLPAPAVPTPTPSLPSGTCPSTPTLPVVLPAPTVPCPDLPSTPTAPTVPSAPASPAPGGSVSVTGTVSVTL
jgi:hypothetical protein